MSMKYDLNHTFVTSDQHFRDWKNGILPESTEEEEAQHIEQWNSVVGKDDHRRLLRRWSGRS